VPSEQGAGPNPRCLQAGMLGSGVRVQVPGLGVCGCKALCGRASEGVQQVWAVCAARIGIVLLSLYQLVL